MLIENLLKALIIKQYKLFLFQSDDAHEPNGELIRKFDETLNNFLISYSVNIEEGFFLLKMKLLNLVIKDMLRI